MKQFGCLLQQLTDVVLWFNELALDVIFLGFCLFTPTHTKKIKTRQQDQLAKV